MSQSIVLVCGGRGFDRDDVVTATLNGIHAGRPITEIIHGGALGADSLADRWAREHRVPVRVFAANWQAYGRAAGPIRNQRMLDYGPDLVVAFPGGRGTADMVRRAAEAGLPVVTFTDKASVLPPAEERQHG